MSVYEVVFGNAVKEMIDLELNIQPFTIFVDFETDIQAAIRKLCQGLTLRDCHVHLGQSWWRHLQKYHLTEESGTDGSEIGNFLKLLSVSPTSIQTTWKNASVTTR